MLLEENELRERLESPLNLLNRLQKAINPHARTPLIPALPPTADDLDIPDLNDKITNGTIKSKAMGLMSSALDELKSRIPEVQKPEKLAAIAAEMSKVINSVEDKHRDSGAIAPQIIIYAPKIMTEEQFDVIDIGES